MPVAHVNCTKIFYKSIGNGDPILFLHGMGAGHRLWEPQEEAFSETHHMIIPDLRGHGYSGDFVFSSFNLELMADDMKHLLDELKLEKVDVIGVSMGAMVALIFAVKYPEYVKKLVVADGYSEFPTNGAKWAVKTIRAVFKRLPWPAIEKLVLSLYDEEKRNEKYTKKLLEHSYTIDKEKFVDMKMSALPNMTGELSKIQAPTLIMGGTGIKYEVMGAKQIFDHVKEATLALFQDMFDPLNVMSKDIFNEMVKDFISDRELKHYKKVEYSFK